jgi:transposase-like protein
VAVASGQGGGYLREHGLYSSLISEWRRMRDAGVLAGKQPGEKIGRLTAEQAEIAWLLRQLDKAERRLVTTEAALVIVGKHTISWTCLPRARGTTPSTPRVDPSAEFYNELPAQKTRR